MTEEAHHLTRIHPETDPAVGANGRPAPMPRRSNQRRLSAGSAASVRSSAEAVCSIGVGGATFGAATSLAAVGFLAVAVGAVR